MLALSMGGGGGGKSILIRVMTVKHMHLLGIGYYKVV